MMVPHVKFRSLRHEDIPALRDLQLALFPVRYTDSFYSRLFSYGYFTLVGFSAEAELIAVASARIVDDDDQLLHDTAYIMTLGIKEMHRRYGLGTRAIQLMLELLATQTSCSMAT